MRLPLVCAALVLLVRGAFGLQPEAGALFIRVVDVGAGLCCVLKMPDGRFMIYDAGDDSKAEAKIEEVIPKNSTIELLVLSHSDSDHLGAVPFICKNYTVKRVIYSGLRKPSSTTPGKATVAWQNTVKWIKKEKDSEGCDDFNLKTRPLTPGTSFDFGDVKVTMVFGLHKPPPDWGFSKTSDESEYYNSGSIVAKVTFNGKSVLLCGDTVGRRIGDGNSVCEAAEHFMVTNASRVPIKADVIVAPHHGADNGSSKDFIAEVNPSKVIFSAGTMFKHPRSVVAQRYEALGLADADMFRTDRGDIRRTDEWDFRAGNGDSSGDDDVDILIRTSGGPDCGIPK